jgi:hypothetical protein
MNLFNKNLPILNAYFNKTYLSCIVIQSVTLFYRLLLQGCMVGQQYKNNITVMFEGVLKQKGRAIPYFDFLTIEG